MITPDGRFGRCSGDVADRADFRRAAGVGGTSAWLPDGEGGVGCGRRSGGRDAGMDPVTVGAVLLAIVSGAAGALGTQLWSGVGTLVRRRRRRSHGGAVGWVG